MVIVIFGSVRAVGELLSFDVHHITSHYSFSGMLRCHVILQIQLSSKTLTTSWMWALERFKIRFAVPAKVSIFVRKEVLGKISTLTELFPAYFAHKGLLTCVDSHMSG